MSQTSITSFFNSRKRPASDDIGNSKNKIRHIDNLQIISKSSKPQVKLIKNQDSINDSGQNRKEDFKQPELPLIHHASRAHENKNKSVFSKKNNATNVAKSVEPTNVIKSIEPTKVVKSIEPTKFDVISKARQELSLGDIRKKLASSSRLSELKTTAERLSKGIQELKESCEQRNLKQFKSFHVEVPSR